MRRGFAGALAAAALVGALPACSGDGHEVVVTREQFAERWPLEVNSAVVVCPGGEHGSLLKIGTRRYALDDAALAQGFPDARQLATAGEGDVAPLRDVCTSVAAAD
jgi:hypothetical protein